MLPSHRTLFETFLEFLSFYSINQALVSPRISPPLQDDTQATVPSLRPRLPPALLGDRQAGGRGPPKHIVQTFHLLRPGI